MDHWSRLALVKSLENRSINLVMLIFSSSFRSCLLAVFTVPEP